MQFTPALAGGLAILTAALDDGETDIADSVGELAACAAAAVSSYLGLSIMAGNTDPPFICAAMETEVGSAEVAASLMLCLLPDRSTDVAGPVVVSLVLYASAAGAFVDLAADLSWMTRDRQVTVILDRHLSRPDVAFTAGSASVINQAVGVLIVRGHVPEDAYRELDARAANADTDRGAAAELLLAELTADAPAQHEGR